MTGARVRQWKRSAALIFMGMAMPVSAWAAPLTTTHYRLDPDVTSNFGGKGSSTNYGLVDAGGEAALGFGNSNSYRLGAGYVAELQKSIQIAVLPSGITNYYSLNTGVGVQAYDSSVNNNTGIIQGTTTWATGQIGGGLTLNGSTGYVNATTSTVNPTTYTLEGWFKTTTTTGGLIMGFGDSQTGSSTNVDRVVYLTNAGNVVFGANPGTKQTITSASTYKDGAWHHVAASMGASGMALYIDGISAGTNANTGSANVTGWWRLGYNNLAGWTSAPTSNFLNGTIDEMKVYNRALNATEVLNEYNAGVAGIVSAQTIPQITAGTSQTALTDVTIRTDGPGYNVAINEDHDLRHTDGTTTIPGITGGTIASPALWAESTTKGLGFTLTAGTQLEAKYGTTPNFKYAALPTVSTTYHTRTNYTAGAPEATTMQFRLDTASAQKSGKYSNTVTVSATVIP